MTPYGIAPDGHRLPAATRLGPVRLQVAELERSIAYYRSVLGLHLLDRGEAHAALGTEPGTAGAGTVLVELRERPGAAPVPRRGRLGLYHFAILLPHRADLGRFAAHLAAIHARVGAADHRVSEALYLHDPDGLGIEVYADRPRSEWDHRGRQLVMATDPLDMESLLQAGAGEPWGGMPLGSVMGHIHLHVGDLAAADAFYHVGIGLDKTVWSYPGALFLSAGGYHHHLGLNTWAAGAQPAGEAHARLLEWEVRLPSTEDVERILESLAAAGHLDAGEVNAEAPGSAAEGAGRVVEDPWGTCLRIDSP
jgi:catechol 2,3-dioxygenase